MIIFKKMNNLKCVLKCNNEIINDWTRVFIAGNISIELYKDDIPINIESINIFPVDLIWVNENKRNRFKEDLDEFIKEFMGRMNARFDRNCITLNLIGLNRFSFAEARYGRSDLPFEDYSIIFLFMYVKEFETSKGHYILIPIEPVTSREMFERLLQINKYKPRFLEERKYLPFNLFIDYNQLETIKSQELLY